LTKKTTNRDPRARRIESSGAWLLYSVFYIPYSDYILPRPSAFEHLTGGCWAREAEGGHAEEALGTRLCSMVDFRSLRLLLPPRQRIALRS